MNTLTHVHHEWNWKLFWPIFWLIVLLIGFSILIAWAVHHGGGSGTMPSQYYFPYGPLPYPWR